MNFDLNSIPKYVIDMSKLVCPSHICHLFSKFKIDKYLYSFTYKGILIKIGMSADKTGAPGERTYRQAGHISSWANGIRLTGSSGSDFRIIEEDFKNLYGFPLDHRHMTLTVWDLTNYPFQTINSRNEILAMEAELINHYEKIVGSKPIGNINDESFNLQRHHIKKQIMANLFENPESLLK